MFPFSAIQGQDALCRALILCAVNPKIRGLLIEGPRGTAKSSAVRAACVLFGQNLITLPLNASAGQLTGSLDFEKTLQNGSAVWEEGLLSRARQGVLYIDEVNLLAPPLADILIAAADREDHFCLMGTMNAQEGEPRPQLLDRFSLFAATKTISDPAIRLQIAKDHREYEAGPELFCAKYAALERALGQRAAHARALLDAAAVPEDCLKAIARRCLDARAAGHRAGLAMREAARAIAALDSRTAVTLDDVAEAAAFALPHRARRGEDPPEQREACGHEGAEKTGEEPRPAQQNAGGGAVPAGRDGGKGRDPEGGTWGEGTGDGEGKAGQGRPASRVFGLGAAFAPRSLAHRGDRTPRCGGGKRTEVSAAGSRGRYAGGARPWRQGPAAFDATLRAAAPYQRGRKREGAGPALIITKDDLREKALQTKQSNLLVFALDSSGSMGAQQRMVETKGAVFSLLRDAYVKRDRLALLVFRGEKAVLALPPTRSAVLAYRLLRDLETGGKTPLNDALRRGYELIKNELRKSPQTLPVLILITDGRGNVSLNGGRPRDELLELAGAIARKRLINAVVIDIEKPGMLALGIARELAGQLGAAYFPMADLKKEAILRIVRSGP
ncbi:MAG: VWA domain-containing protein [Treponema sp.]|jgi:magnesium chelatase subunit D|nr:VWA domain-containing protein [Treponema sp.]